ncbi:alginate export family protein [Agaribacter marinus]|uniref:Alginate export domain-containing protein n=1 Tax=Agaribacter marinus TaxID=1431249 RepID=A0AA37T236_9ALTE|nr:alginate export family protein [Agaribacter marinus]GLR70988.1 hypothetical protein GCM10007852_18960 [Agaribacter marinus]
MNTFSKRALAVCVTTALLGGIQSAQANETVYDALISGKAFGNVNLRYEGVEQDNALSDATALTLRTRLGYKTGEIGGFSALVEFEDNRIVLGQSDYSVPPTGFKPGEYSVIADPEHTELDQGFVQYKNDKYSVKVGRQVITHDGHRFIGHVGWRQDRQTFDGVRFQYSATKDLSFEYSYLTQRNRIFAEQRDLDSSDHLFRASYKLGSGSLVGYGYLLEVDNPGENTNALDTFGLKYAGSSKAGDTKIIYHAEYAKQSSESGANEFDTDYLFLEGGAVFSGITAKVGYEVLGSDNGQAGFATPLATLHKFNGWSDQFLGTPAQGLKDLTFTLAGKVAGGKWLAAYHKFDADSATEGLDDFGSEINLQYVTKVAKNYTLAVKYAAFSAEDRGVDTDKLWVWLSTKF